MSAPRSATIPIKEHDRGNGSRSYIGAKTKKMQSRVKQMEKRIGREIREKEGLLKDLEVPADLKLTKLSHHKSVLVEARDYSIRYRDTGRPVFEGLGFSHRKRRPGGSQRKKRLWKIDSDRRSWGKMAREAGFWMWRRPASAGRRRDL